MNALQAWMSVFLAIQAISWLVTLILIWRLLAETSSAVTEILSLTFVMRDFLGLGGKVTSK